jgi:Ser/Thr protein kinase RdoA (MazF antagonist)
LHDWRVLDAWAHHWRVVRSLSQSSGARSRVALVELDGRPAVARLGPHAGRALEWEVGLLEWLARCGVGAPRVLPARDGQGHVGGCLVTEHVEGAPVSGDRDWALVRATLRRLHHCCGGWPQRPDHLSSRELLTYEQGGDVDLGAMPPDARRRCREAWQPVGRVATTVVHGDPRPANVRIVGGRAVLVGWGRARVDAPLFDLVALPRNGTAGLDGLDIGARSGRDHLHGERWVTARRAWQAWEAARAWVTEPTYARRQLDQLR